jgi:hypothetical protein
MRQCPMTDDLVSLEESPCVRSRRRVRRMALVACVLATVGAVNGCSSAGQRSVPVGAVPHAPVSAAQRASLAHYYLTKLWLPDGFARVGCPVDVIGAARTGHELRVYGVVDCTSVTKSCDVGTQGTSGLVADLVGTDVIHAWQDDAIDEAGLISEAEIYPPSVRSAAVNDINTDGPSWLRTEAARVAGCPEGVHY